MKYKASLDITSKIITVGIILFSIIICFAAIQEFSRSSHTITSNFSVILVTLFLILLILICYLFSTKFYELENNYLIIHRPIGPINFPISEIKEITKIEELQCIRYLMLFYNLINSTRYHHICWLTDDDSIIRTPPLIVVTSSI